MTRTPNWQLGASYNPADEPPTASDALRPAAISYAISVTIASRPSGGTDRERQAWSNGLRDLAEQLGEPFGSATYFYPALGIEVPDDGTV